MKKGTHDDVRRRFERDAGSFSAIYRLERSPWSRWFNKTFRKAIFDRYEMTFEHSGDVTGKEILDVGCGSGVYSVDFARRGARRVLGIDFSANMLALARVEAQQHGVEKACEFVKADFIEAELAPRSFDIAIAMGVFDYLPAPEPFLRKMATVTRGKVIASFPGHSLLREPARRLRYLLTGRGDVYFYREDEIRSLAARAGVERIVLYPLHSSGGGYLLVGNCSG
jgi:2-polyprenyl-3-methyl-5-hydroxy-6-metoxy-1,4-benzoquinol methylase